MQRKGEPRRATSFASGSSTSASAGRKGSHGRPGNVQFSCHFESGNIGEVVQLSECEYNIKIRPDTNNNRHRLWFYFSMCNVRAQQQRIPSSQVLYHRSPKGPGNRMAYVMSFLYQFDGDKDGPYYSAYAFPYTYTDLQRYLYSLERQQLPFLTREALCRTLQQRRVELLTITAPEGEPGARPLRERKWVFITARVHPGETPAQFIVHGVIDFLTGNTPRAQALRGNVVFKIVPMLNPDGVVNGNYRCSYLGFDLNRHWLDPSDWAHPEILSVKTLVAELHKDPSVNLDFFVGGLHGISIYDHAVGTNSFMYGNNIPDRRNKFVTTPCSTGRIPPTSPYVEAGAKTSGAVPASPQQQQAQGQRTTVKEENMLSLTRTILPISAPLATPPTPLPASTSSLPPEPRVPVNCSTSASDAAMAANAAITADRWTEAPSTAAVAARRQALLQSSVDCGCGGRSGSGGSSGDVCSSDGDGISGSAGSYDDGTINDDRDGGSDGSVFHERRQEEEGGSGSSTRSSSSRDNGRHPSAVAGKEGIATTSGVGVRIARGAGAVVAGKVPDLHGGVASVFPRMLATNAPDFSFARSKFDADLNKEGTGRRALGQLLSPDVLYFTLEASFFASQRDDGVGLVPYTRGGYIDLGRALASTFFDFYGLQEAVVGRTGGGLL